MKKEIDHMEKKHGEMESDGDEGEVGENEMGAAEEKKKEK